jgi:tetratricopeptide (TPR) repeat protein
MIDSEIKSRFYRHKGKSVPREVMGFMQRLEFDAGIAYLDDLLEKDPDFEDAWVKKGIFCQLSQRNKEAVAAYDKALEINPNNLQAKEGREKAARGLE